MHPNVQSALKEGKITYTTHLHASYNKPIKNPADFAAALGYDIQRITKSVFFRSVDKEKYAVAVCSIDKKLNFPLLATQLGCRKVEVASKDELQQIIGYASTGVTPLGVDSIKIFVDRSLLDFETILTGAGIPGVEIELSPNDLMNLTGALLLDIILT